MANVIQRALDLIRALAQGRSPKFPAAERAFIRRNPRCYFCGRPSKTAHHSYPFHAYKELEMDERYWVPVDAACHRPLGHGGDWRKWVLPAGLVILRRLLMIGDPNSPRAVARVIAQYQRGPARPPEPVVPPPEPFT